MIVVRDFGFTLDDVNWLGNIIACVYLPAAILTPILTKRYGIRNTVCPLSHIPRCNLTSFIQCHIATFSLLLSAWVRYAGTGRSLPKHGAYALVIIGQVRTPSPTLLFTLSSYPFLQALSGFSQPVYQILAPKYSERWFDLKGRTTATMIISIGGAILVGNLMLFV